MGGLDRIFRQKKETTKTEEQSDKPIRERIKFPHAEAAVKMFEKYAQKEGVDADLDTVKDLFDTFLEQDIENTEVWESKRFPGVSFPMTTLDVNQFARALYQSRAHDQKAVESYVSPGARTTKEFVFGSFPFVQQGSTFTFFEEAFHQLVMKLPAAIEALKRGEEPEHYDISILGTPTNILGTMTDDFADCINRENAFDLFGELYAERISEELQKDGDASTNVYLYGISMGASFAAKTGEKLLASGAVTQSFRHDDSQPSDEGRPPRMSIRADVPVGMIETDNPARRAIKIPFNFIATEGPLKMMTDSYTRAAGPGEGAFVKQVNAEYAKRGMSEHVSQEEVALKKKVLSDIRNNLTDGTPISPQLKMDIVRAEYDPLVEPLVFPSMFRIEAKEHKAEHKGVLGQNLVSRTEGNRTTAINQTHSMVFFRKNEMRRITKAIQALQDIK